MLILVDRSQFCIRPDRRRQPLSHIQLVSRRRPQPGARADRVRTQPPITTRSKTITVVTELRERKKIEGTLSGANWEIERRGRSLQDCDGHLRLRRPKDGIPASDAVCRPMPSAADPVAGAPTEVNPDDSRRITFTLTWTARGRAGAARRPRSSAIRPVGSALASRASTSRLPQVTADFLTWGGTNLRFRLDEHVGGHRPLDRRRRHKRGRRGSQVRRTGDSPGTSDPHFHSSSPTPPWVRDGIAEG